jgi:hypothetical protein
MYSDIVKDLRHRIKEETVQAMEEIVQEITDQTGDLLDIGKFNVSGDFSIRV